MSEVKMQAGCKLYGENGVDDFWGQARDISGLFEPLEGGLRRVKLTGLNPGGRLLKCITLNNSKSAHLGNADLTLLDCGEVEIGSYFVADVHLDSIATSVEGGGIYDAVVTLDCETILPGSGVTWNLLRSKELNRNGIWRSLDRRGRRAWLSVALNHHGYRKPSVHRLDLAYAIDGSHIFDESSFYCALGEAVNGPAGYFGWNLSALDDCLSGEWGAVHPMVLDWNFSQDSRDRLREDAQAAIEYEGKFLEFLSEIFYKRNVTVNYL
ncbi:barstar family protein [Streptomyces sp. NPDC059271]|uniref:barstar family protein n=1 Tax=Streptomyces sp. NPDC059271 TaxID=3346799 RepID=UPI003675A613